MPNRILRDWTDSESVDKLSVHAERFFTRLIMKVDDFGRYSANEQLLKSNLYPLKTDIRSTDVSLWIAECKTNGLITTYHVAHKEYLQIENFKQVLRQKREKYPSPSTCLADDKQMTSIRQSSASLKRNETETKPNPNLKFRLREKIIEKSITDFFKENFQTFLQTWEMQNKDFPPEKVFARMETDYAAYNFNNENHLQNSFKSTYEKLQKEKKYANNKQITRGTEVVTGDKNYGTL